VLGELGAPGHRRSAVARGPCLRPPRPAPLIPRRHSSRNGHDMTAKNNPPASDDQESIPHLGDSLARLQPEPTNPTRLGIVPSLKNRARAECRLLRAALGFPDAVLSRHITALANTGAVEVKTGYVGKRPRTWVASTAAGAIRLESRFRALRDLVGA